MKTILLSLIIGFVGGFITARAWWHVVITKGKEAFADIEAKLKAKYGS